MHDASVKLAKVLRKFTDQLFPSIQALAPLGTREDVDGCFSISMHANYPNTLNALAKLRTFRGDEKMADAYICGYYRGLQEAAFRMNQRRRDTQEPLNKPHDVSGQARKSGEQHSGV